VASAPLKIGITGYPVPGGSGVVASELGRLLARRGHQIHFIAYAPPFRLNRYDEKLFFHEVEVSHYPLFKYPPYTLALAVKMVEVSRQFDLDILHVHYAIPHATAGFLARSILGNPARPRLVTTLHGTDITLVGSERSFYDITCFSIRAANGVTAISHYLKAATIKTFPACTDIEVIPNFIDLAAFSPARTNCERSTFAEPGEILLAHLSNFRPVKRPVDTVRVLAAVHKERPARLLLIGDGPEMATVIAEAEALRVRDRIHFLGNQDDVQPLLACADVFLLPSEEESFGLAALEALACGTPAVTSSVGGLGELMIHGENGFMVPLGDTAAMARHVLEIARDGETLAAFRARARESAKRFDADTIIPMYEELYFRILS
jgi:N-acetyl-alpha-D-glucosaminyl L-malate synthase BshA